MTTSFVGEAQVSIFVALTLRSGLKLYAATGIKPNRNWTPTAMLSAAGNVTGQKFKRGQYQQAVDALTVWIDENRPAAFAPQG